jgi:hypothetical protein
MYAPVLWKDGRRYERSATIRIHDGSGVVNGQKNRLARSSLAGPVHLTTMNLSHDTESRTVEARTSAPVFCNQELSSFWISGWPFINHVSMVESFEHLPAC